jgi:large subunit ribosomal protein L6
MSKIGEKPIQFANNVKVTVDGQNVKVEGSKGTLQFTAKPEIKISVTEGKVLVERKDESTKSKSLHGLTRTLISNMIVGIDKGWSKGLELSGVGYRASVEGDTLVLSVGFSHQVRFKLPEGISANVVENKITITGADKQAVGEITAQIRRIRPPEPYKGKGIKYVGEKIRRKAGKTAKALGAAPSAGGAK